MKSNLVAKRYANSLFLEAVHTKGVKTVYKSMQSLDVWLKDVIELNNVLSSSLIALEHKQHIWDKLVAKYKVDKLTSRFVHLVIEHDRANLLEAIIVAFTIQYNAHFGIEHVEIECANKISEAEQQAIVGHLIGKRKEINIKVTNNPKLIGGFVVKKSNFILDASIKGKLETIKDTISSGV